MTLSSSIANLEVDGSIILEQDGGILTLWLNHPESRNAMSLKMVQSMQAVFAAIKDDVSVRAVILRGKGGHFCAGGNIKDMAGIRAKAMEVGNNTPYTEFNRTFGALIEQVDQAPQTVVAVLEGAVLGGGFGLACVSDVAIAHAEAQFGLPETGLGILPAQIAPFVVTRVGLTQARRLALLGMRFKGQTALEVGIVHQVVADEVELASALEETITQIKRCAPLASRATKALLHRTTKEELGPLLDDAARQFADAVASAEGMEGTMAFIQKRQPSWAE